MISLRGELGLSSLGELQATLDVASAAKQPRVCLDLAELRFIDSSGLATMTRAHLAIVEAGGALVLVCVPGPVQRTVSMTGLLSVLTVCDTREAAIESLAGSA